MKLLYEGKAKKIFEEERGYVLFFKDSVTAGDGAKREEIEGKGEIAAKISAKLFTLLEEGGVRTHFISTISKREIVVHPLKMFPLEIVVRNIAAGSITKRLGIARGTSFSPPLLEFYLKSDVLHDPLICESHIPLLKLASETQLEKIKQYSLKANRIISHFFSRLGFVLVDIKFEYGTSREGDILLGDELSPDVMRIWDRKTHESYDKDVFREGKGDLLEAYKEVAKRMGIL